ncbi:MAG TPA: alpha/beta hydrolase [Gemmatimonadaceae bacterium]|nr:alpha/beta hydrolase [Gemmatimonadaceae bacterium]
MHVERYGHGGAPIVLIHGFGTSSFLWRNVGPAIALANRTAFAIDLFGYGESDRPFDADFGIAAQAELVDRALTALRLPKATMVGVDLGGAVALRLAASRPERVDRLLLINPIALDEIPSGDITELQRNTARYAFRASRGILGAAPILGEVLRRSVANEASMPDKLVARYLAPYVGEEGLNHLLLLARAIDDEDMEDAELGSLPQPTLIIWGDQDQWVGPRFPDRLSDAIPGSRLVRLPGVGRLVPEEVPDTVVSVLLEFIGAAALHG